MINTRQALRIYDSMLKAGVRAINHYGAAHQVCKAMEEMSELKLEIERILDNRDSVVRIREEMADVLFTNVQMALIYGVDEVFDVLMFKIRRLNDRITKEELKIEKNGRISGKNQ